MRPYNPPGIGWVFALIGLILTVIFGVLGRLDTTHAVLFGLAFLAALV